MVASSEPQSSVEKLTSPPPLEALLSYLPALFEEPLLNDLDEVYLLVEGGDEECDGPLEGLNPFPNGNFDKQPSLSLFIIPAFCA